MSADEKIDDQELEDALDAFNASFPQVLSLEKLFKSRGRSFGHAMIVLKFKQLQDWWEEWYEVEVKDKIFLPSICHLAVTNTDTITDTSIMASLVESDR